MEANIRIEEHQIAGVRTVVREAGPEGATEAAVFVHGNPGSGEDWAGLLPSVGAVVRAVAPDMPGYGRSEKPDDFDYTVEGYAAFLDAVITALAIERVHLVLHDFGGPWGLAWAADHPQRVASLVLVNIGVLAGYRWHRFARIWRTPVLGELFMLFTTRTAVGWLLRIDNPKPFPRAFVDRVHRDIDAGTKRAVLRLYRASKLGPITTQLGARLAPHRIPALVLWGEEDAYVPVRFAEQQSEYFAAEVHRLPGCGHWPMIDAPEVVRDHIVRFLSEQR